MRRVAWIALALVVIGALTYGVTDRSKASASERAHKLGETIMCPACSGESVADSQAPAAVFIRRQIDDKIAKGESDQQIRDELAAAYGERVILTLQGDACRRSAGCRISLRICSESTTRGPGRLKY